MKPRTWMIPTLPIAAIACGWIIVIGGARLMKNWSEFFPNESRQTGKALDSIFDKVLSEQDWLAAGLPAGESSFVRWSFREDARHFTSERSLGRQGSIRASLRLEIDVPADAASRRVASSKTDEAERVKLAEGFVKSGSDPGRSWSVFAGRRLPNDQHEDLSARCFHDGVLVTVWTRGVATREQTEGFKRLIEGAAERLATVCAGDLLPYIERATPR
jgi:hypothetical protein